MSIDLHLGLCECSEDWLKCSAASCSLAMRSTLNMTTMMSMLMGIVRAMKRPTEQQRRISTIDDTDSFFPWSTNRLPAALAAVSELVTSKVNLEQGATQ